MPIHSPLGAVTFSRYTPFSVDSIHTVNQDLGDFLSVHQAQDASLKMAQVPLPIRSDHGLYSLILAVFGNATDGPKKHDLSVEFDFEGFRIQAMLVGDAVALMDQTIFLRNLTGTGDGIDAAGRAARTLFDFMVAAEPLFIQKWRIAQAQEKANNWFYKLFRRPLAVNPSEDAKMAIKRAVSAGHVVKSPPH